MSTLDHPRNGTRLAALWFAVLGPPVIWAIRFAVSYTLVPYACAAGALLPLHLLTLGSLAATAAAGLIAWKHWGAAGRSTQVEFGGADARARFMALVGLLSSGLFVAVIVAEWLAVFFIDPCQTGGPPL